MHTWIQCVNMYIYTHTLHSYILTDILHTHHFENISFMNISTHMHTRVISFVCMCVHTFFIYVCIHLYPISLSLFDEFLSLSLTLSDTPALSFSPSQIIGKLHSWLSNLYRTSDFRRRGKEKHEHLRCRPETHAHSDAHKSAHIHTLPFSVHLYQIGLSSTTGMFGPKQFGTVAGTTCGSSAIA